MTGCNQYVATCDITDAGGMAFGDTLDIVNTRMAQLSKSTYTVGAVEDAKFEFTDPPVARAIYAVFEVRLLAWFRSSSLSRSARLYLPCPTS